MSEASETTPPTVDAARRLDGWRAAWETHRAEYPQTLLFSAEDIEVARHAAQCVRALAWLAAHPDCEGTWVGMGGAPAEGWRVVQLVGVGADDGYRTLAKGSPTPLAALLAAMEATT